MRPAPKKGALPTALWLLRVGLWPVPIEKHAKKPIGRAWGANYPTRDKLLNTFEQHHGAGVGIALGPAAGLVDFEIDDQDVAAALLGRIELPDTLGWQSSRGRHRLFLWDKRLEQLLTSTVAHFRGAELRAGGEEKQLVSVCPPSVGTDRRCRRWNGVWEVVALPMSLLKELEQRRVQQQERGPPTPPLPRTQTGTSRYGEAALRYEAKAVREAKEGTRNATLNRAAFCLGQLVVAGVLCREAVEKELSEAALSAGLGEREIAGTLRSGLEAGMLRPRKV
jgi:putative DNA primase/helicase